MMGIYKITEKLTGRCYVGQSINIKHRWKQHNKRFPPLDFDYEFVVSCFKESLDFWEELCVVDYNAHFSCGGFNLTWGAKGGGRSKTPEETARKRSEALKGRPRSAEHNAKISASMKGKKKTQEHKLKISETQKKLLNKEREQ